LPGFAQTHADLWFGSMHYRWLEVGKNRMTYHLRLH